MIEVQGSAAKNILIRSMRRQIKHTLAKLSKDEQVKLIKKKLSQIKTSISKKLKDLGEQQFSSDNDHNKKKRRVGTIQGPIINFSLS